MWPPDLHVHTHTIQSLVFLLKHLTQIEVVVTFRGFNYTGSYKKMIQGEVKPQQEKHNNNVIKVSKCLISPLFLPHRLLRGHLSFVISPGSRCLRREWLECGLLVRSLVNQSFALYSFPSLETKESRSTSHLGRVLLGPGLRNFYTGVMILTPQVSQLGTTLVQAYQLSRCTSGSDLG